MAQKECSSSTHVIRAIKSRKLTLAGHIKIITDIFFSELNSPFRT